MSQSSPLRVLSFPERLPSSSLKFLNTSALPSSQQAKLSEMVSRFDRVMKERPAVAARIMVLVDKIFRVFDA